MSERQSSLDGFNAPTSDVQSGRPWRDVADECAEFNADGGVRRVPGGFGGESEKHMVKKLIVAHILDEIGEYESVRLEVTGSSGLQYDVFASGGESEPIAAEVGNLNCPVRKLDDRLRATYEDASAVVLWPHSLKRQIRVLYEGVYDRPPCPVSGCGNVSREVSVAHGITGKFPPSSKYGATLMCSDICENDGFATYVFLDHLYSPEMFHRRLRDTGYADGGADDE